MLDKFIKTFVMVQLITDIRHGMAVLTNGNPTILPRFHLKVIFHNLARSKNEGSLNVFVFKGRKNERPFSKMGGQGTCWKGSSTFLPPTFDTVHFLTQKIIKIFDQSWMESTSDRKASIFSSIWAFSSGEILVEFFFGLFCFGTRAGFTILFQSLSQYTELNYKHSHFINASVDRKRSGFNDSLTFLLIMNHKRWEWSYKHGFEVLLKADFDSWIQNLLIFCLFRKIIFVLTCSRRPKELIQRQLWTKIQLCDG